MEWLLFFFHLVFLAGKQWRRRPYSKHVGYSWESTWWSKVCLSPVIRFQCICYECNVFITLFYWIIVLARTLEDLFLVQGTGCLIDRAMCGVNTHTCSHYVYFRSPALFYCSVEVSSNHCSNVANWPGVPRSSRNWTRPLATVEYVKHISGEIQSLY